MKFWEKIYTDNIDGIAFIDNFGFHKTMNPKFQWIADIYDKIRIICKSIKHWIVKNSNEIVVGILVGIALYIICKYI